MRAPLILIALAVLVASCGDDETPTTTTTTHSQPPPGGSGGEGGAPPATNARKMTEVGLLDGYTSSERSQSLHFDFVATNATFLLSLDAAGQGPLGSKEYLARAPVGQAVVELLGTERGAPALLATHVYVDGTAPLDASIWIGRYESDEPVDGGDLGIVVIATARAASEPTATDLVPNEETRVRLGDIEWTRYEAALPPGLVGWGYDMVSYAGARPLFVNGHSVHPAAEGRASPAPWRALDARERLALPRLRERSRAPGPRPRAPGLFDSASKR